LPPRSSLNENFNAPVVVSLHDRVSARDSINQTKEAAGHGLRKRAVQSPPTEGVKMKARIFFIILLIIAAAVAGRWVTRMTSAAAAASAPATPSNTGAALPPPPPPH
jgi:phage terminase large subunit-like protein